MCGTIRDAVMMFPDGSVETIAPDIVATCHDRIYPLLDSVALREALHESRKNGILRTDMPHVLDIPYARNHTQMIADIQQDILALLIAA